MLNTLIGMDEKLTEIIVEFAIYLRKNKFDISVDAIISFCKILPKINIFNYDEFYNILKSLFCSNLYTFEMFDRLFHDYMYKRFEAYVKDIQNQEKEKLEKEANFKTQEAIKKIQEKLQAQKEELNKFLDMIDKKIPVPNASSISEESIEFANKKGKQILNLELQKTSDIVKKIEKNSNWIDKYKKKLKDLLLANLSDKNYEDINKLVFGQLERLNKILKELEHKKDLELNSTKKAEKLLETKKRNIEKEQSKKLEELSIKYGSKEHRKKFIGKSAVIDLLQQQDKTIGNLSKNEYKSLIYYIKLNSSKFRTKVSLSMKQGKRKVIDMKRTVQQGFKYEGIPIKIYYKKPIVKKYKLFCMFDISGSVSEYLNLLIPFIMELNIVFNGGIEIYGFVNSLINFTENFRENSIEELLKQIKGYHGYSNYYTALNEFYDITYGKMDKNSIIIYFGDARNNKNNSGSNFLSAIKDKTKYTIWLNPEENIKWNVSDSIIADYSNNVDIVYEIHTVRQLIYFLNDFSIK